MKKTLIIFVVCSTIFTSICLAQDGAVERINAGQLAFNKFTYPANILFEQKLRNFNPDLFKSNENGEFVLDFNNFKGSPYEINTFSFGFITDELSNKSVNIYLRYNIYNDEVELKVALEKEEKIIALLKEHDISCTINGKYYQYSTYTDESGATKDGYLIQVYKGKNYELFKRLKSSFTPKKPSENSYIPPQKAKFETAVSYYLKHGTSLVYLPEKSKLLYSKYGKQSTALKNYLSHNNGTTLKHESNFIEIVKLLDSAN